MPLDELERQALAARPPDDDNRGFADWMPGGAVSATVLGGLIAVLEFLASAYLERLLPGTSGLWIWAAAVIGLPVLSSAVARRTSGRISGVLRFLTRAFLIGAVGSVLLLWILAAGMRHLRFG